MPPASVTTKVLSLMVAGSIASLNCTSCLRFGATPFTSTACATTVGTGPVPLLVLLLSGTDVAPHPPRRVATVKADVQRRTGRIALMDGLRSSCLRFLDASLVIQ